MWSRISAGRFIPVHFASISYGLGLPKDEKEMRQVLSFGNLNNSTRPARSEGLLRQYSYLLTVVNEPSVLSSDHYNSYVFARVIGCSRCLNTRFSVSTTDLFL